jgi:hypothetical protein
MKPRRLWFCKSVALAISILAALLTSSAEQFDWYNRCMNDDEGPFGKDDKVDEEVNELMDSHDLGPEAAERVRDIMDQYGVNEDDAVDLEESGID